MYVGWVQWTAKCEIGKKEKRKKFRSVYHFSFFYRLTGGSRSFVLSAAQKWLHIIRQKEKHAFWNETACKLLGCGEDGISLS
jgi:hypothetical protein